MLQFTLVEMMFRIRQRLVLLCAFSLCLLALLVIGLPQAWADANSGAATTSEQLDPNKSYDVGFMLGTLIPRSDGLTNLIPGWGLRGSMPTDKGIFELSGFSGIGNGIVYRTGAVDFRLDFPVETIAAHFLLGLHADQYSQIDPAVSKSFAGGWHYGGGFTAQIIGPTFFRFEFRQRFGPGQVVEVTTSIVYRFPAGN